MPMIRVELLSGRSFEQKREFAEVVTREAARILNFRPEVVDIVFSEVARQDRATAGKLAADKAQSTCRIASAPTSTRRSASSDGPPISPSAAR